LGAVDIAIRRKTGSAKVKMTLPSLLNRAGFWTCEQRENLNEITSPSYSPSPSKKRMDGDGSGWATVAQRNTVKERTFTS
jgi:hypothetical protein